MKLTKAIAIIYTVFGIATAGMVLISFIMLKDEKLINKTFGYYFGIIYMIIVAITIIALIVNIAIMGYYMIKINGGKKVFKHVAISFMVGMIIAIAVSLIKYKEIISIDLLYIPFALIFLSSAVSEFKLLKK